MRLNGLIASQISSGESASPWNITPLILTLARLLTPDVSAMLLFRIVWWTHLIIV